MRQTNNIQELKEEETNANNNIDLNFDILIDREQTFVSIAFATLNKAFSTIFSIS